jgi:hypothetical protein
VDGLVSAEEMDHTLDRIYADGPTKFILWDMSKCDLSVVAPDELHEFTQKAAQLGAERKEGLTAIIAPEDLHPAFTTLVKLFTSILPFRLKIFSSRMKALTWLFPD